MDNMELWNKVEDTDPAFTKGVSLGKYKFTDIDSMWNIKRATALWGPYGSTWGLKTVTYNFIQAKEDVVGIAMHGTFFYPDGFFDILADMPYEGRGETLKKLQTMCIGKALSRLGFSADVYMGKFEDSAYVRAQEEKYAQSTNSNSDIANSVAVSTVGQPEVKKTYPEPDPVASGILGTLAQNYMDLLEAEYDSGKRPQAPELCVDFKKMYKAVYDAFGQYPTKNTPENLEKIIATVPLDKVIVKNDFLEGIN